MLGSQKAPMVVRQTGVAWVSTRYSNHAGPASLYARRPLEHNMLGLYFAVGNANHLPPWGGMDMLLSTNPIAAGIPAGEEPPVANRPAASQPVSGSTPPSTESAARTGCSITTRRLRWRRSIGRS